MISFRRREQVPAWGTPPEQPQAGAVAVIQDDRPVPVEPVAPVADEPIPTADPVFVDVVSRGELRPVIPAWMHSRAGWRAAASWWAHMQWHRTRFHGVRLPTYAARTLLRAPVGAWRVSARLARWVTDAQADSMEQALSVNRGDAKPFLQVREQRSERVQARLLTLAVLVLACLAGLAVGARMTPRPVHYLALAAGLVALARAGTDRDKPFIPQALTTYEAPKLTAPVLERALGSLGIKAINDALVLDGPGLDYPAPIVRDEGGRGYRADVDLPHGVTPDEIIEKREKLASGLRRPLGCVWPEGDPEVHEGRLVLRVLDHDFAKAKAPAWPLQKAGRHDYFKPYPFGWDVRGRLIQLHLFELNGLFGALPGQGKSATIRVTACAGALDPSVELWICELAGKGDFAELEQVSNVYVNGLDDTSIERAATAMARLRMECERRTAQLGKVPADMKPDKKITRQIADHRSWGLYPIVAVFDEVQNLFTHSEFGKQAGQDAEKIIRMARAVGITLILATQIPDKTAIPPQITRLAGVRFCLKVMDHVANDMILGTSMHKGGFKATGFRVKVDAGIGILVGATDMPTIVRSAYLDGPAVESIARRARRLREAAGTITGHAAGEDGDQPTVTVVNVAADVRAVYRPGESALWNEHILERLRELRPGYYDDWTKTMLTSALTRLGIEAGRQVFREKTNQRGVYLDDLLAALPSGADEPAGVA